MSDETILQRGRRAFDERAWNDAYASLTAAEASPLEPADLELLATAAYLTGRDEPSADAWARAYRGHLEAGEQRRAARAAFWLAFSLMQEGEMARSGGWLARASKLLEDEEACAEHGLIMMPAALGTLMGGDPETAIGMFEQMIEIGERYRDPDVLAFGKLGRGQSLVTAERHAEGIELLDEVMVAITADEVSPTVAGLVYCAVIEACHDCFDVKRASEWTHALNDWCATQPDLVPYRGQCLVHRSEIMTMHGAWADALEEARRARQRLSDPPNPAIGMAYYQLGELHRLRGEFAEAEASYREANERGREPQPGLALLRLAQGQVDAAAGTMRRALEEAHDAASRAKLLSACVEIMLASDDAGVARAAADELGKIASDLHAPQLKAIAAQSNGAVLMAEGDTHGALESLRAALSAWRDLDAPYEAARVRVLLATVCRMLGDDDTAGLELDAARSVFERLGAAPDLAAVEGTQKKATHGLTRREVEVLQLIATGKTNRVIAEELVISEKTVARHISNIFTKLGLSSRAAATAFAYENELV